MKTKFSLLFLLITISFLASQCKKDSPESLLPPITSTGANTFGCLIDGLAMLPSDGVPTVEAPYPHKGRELVFDQGGNTADFSFYNEKGKSPAPFYLNIHLTEFSNLQPGNYKWQQTSFGAGNVDNQLHHVYGSFYDNEIKDYAWFGSYDSSGTTIITRMDTVNHIISGTFYGKLRKRDGGTKEVTISDGRFDIKWRQ